MARSTQQQRRDERRARATAERVTADQTRGEYRPPDRSTCTERSWYQSVDDADTVRVDHRLFRSGGRLVDFAILVHTLDIDGEWIEAARVDCCHGYVHLHHTSGEVSSIGPVHRADDVAALFAVASDQAMRYAVTIRDMKGRDERDV
jgi:hypothetical protein